MWDRTCNLTITFRHSNRLNYTAAGLPKIIIKLNLLIRAAMFVTSAFVIFNLASISPERNLCSFAITRPHTSHNSQPS